MAVEGGATVFGGLTSCISLLSVGRHCSHRTVTTVENAYSSHLIRSCQWVDLNDLINCVVDLPWLCPTSLLVLCVTLTKIFIFVHTRYKKNNRRWKKLEWFLLIPCRELNEVLWFMLMFCMSTRFSILWISSSPNPLYSYILHFILFVFSRREFLRSLGRRYGTSSLGRGRASYMNYCMVKMTEDDPKTLIDSWGIDNGTNDYMLTGKNV